MSYTTSARRAGSQTSSSVCGIFSPNARCIVSELHKVVGPYFTEVPLVDRRVHRQQWKGRVRDQLVLRHSLLFLPLPLLPNVRDPALQFGTQVGRPRANLHRSATSLTEPPFPFFRPI